MVSTGATGGSAGRDSLPAETLRELRQITARYPQARSALLPMLHLVQSVEGRVTARGIEACADILGISAAEVSGVATFYTMYKRRPVGDYHVGVCTNTLCAVMGGDEIFERLKDHLDVGNDETTEDGKITLEHVECNAACDYAPVMMVNWEFMDNMTPQSATQLVDDLREGKEVHSTRGPRICTWREAERVLAGFPDDRADEGPAAGPASLVGLDLARERGWRAPETGRRSVPAGHDGRPSHGEGDKETAVREADTHRAGSETRLDESPTDVKGGKGSNPEADGKGTNE
ncbi:MAG TPA: NADH-quinone oxidoreductase subunit NuoE [Nocardioidaceae bacterium]|nr:NADH-quinone oxidoreductase subunit NuoE [Nocardioidaceae bacterium]